MMVAVSKSAPARSPERQVLADALAVRDAAAERLRATTAALSDFNEKLSATRGRFQAADEALSEAKEELREALQLHGGDEDAAAAHVMRAGKEPPREAVARAESAYARAEENLELGRDGQHKFKGAKINAEKDLEWAESKVGKAVEAVCQTKLPALLDEAEKARDAFTGKLAVIQSVSSQLDGVCFNYMINREPLPSRIRDFLSSAHHNREMSGLEAWNAARKALSIDPDAGLPE